MGGHHAFRLRSGRRREQLADGDRIGAQDRRSHRRPRDLELPLQRVQQQQFLHERLPRHRAPERLCPVRIQHRRPQHQHRQRRHDDHRQGRIRHQPLDGGAHHQHLLHQQKRKYRHLDRRPRREAHCQRRLRLGRDRRSRPDDLRLLLRRPRLLLALLVQHHARLLLGARQLRLGLGVAAADLQFRERGLPPVHEQHVRFRRRRLHQLGRRRGLQPQMGGRRSFRRQRQHLQPFRLRHPSGNAYRGGKFFGRQRLLFRVRHGKRLQGVGVGQRDRRGRRRRAPHQRDRPRRHGRYGVQQWNIPLGGAVEPAEQLRPRRAPEPADVGARRRPQLRRHLLQRLHRRRRMEHPAQRLQGQHHQGQRGEPDLRQLLLSLRRPRRDRLRLGRQRHHGQGHLRQFHLHRLGRDRLRRPRHRFDQGVLQPVLHEFRVLFQHRERHQQLGNQHHPLARPRRHALRIRRLERRLRRGDGRARREVRLRRRRRLRLEGRPRGRLRSRRAGHRLQGGALHRERHRERHVEPRDRRGPEQDALRRGGRQRRQHHGAGQGQKLRTHLAVALPQQRGAPRLDGRHGDQRAGDERRHRHGAGRHHRQGLRRQRRHIVPFRLGRRVAGLGRQRQHHRRGAAPRHHRAQRRPAQRGRPARRDLRLPVRRQGAQHHRQLGRRHLERRHRQRRRLRERRGLRGQPDARQRSEGRRPHREGLHRRHLPRLEREPDRVDDHHRHLERERRRFGDRHHRRRKRGLVRQRGRGRQLDDHRLGRADDLRKSGERLGQLSRRQRDRGRHRHPRRRHLADQQQVRRVSDQRQDQRERRDGVLPRQGRERKLRPHRAQRHVDGELGQRHFPHQRRRADRLRRRIRLYVRRPAHLGPVHERPAVDVHPRQRRAFGRRPPRLRLLHGDERRQGTRHPDQGRRRQHRRERLRLGAYRDCREHRFRLRHQHLGLRQRRGRGENHPQRRLPRRGIFRRRERRHHARPRGLRGADGQPERNRPRRAGDHGGRHGEGRRRQRGRHHHVRRLQGSRHGVADLEQRRRPLLRDADRELRRRGARRHSESGRLGHHHRHALRVGRSPSHRPRHRQHRHPVAADRKEQRDRRR